MSTLLFPGNDDSTSSKLPEGIVTGSRKRKQAFSLHDPDNIEVQRLATQAARKKAKLSKSSVPSNSRQASIEEVEEEPHLRIFPKNPRNIIESDDDDDDDGIATQAAKKKAKISKTETRKSKNKPAPKSNRQASMEDIPDIDLTLPQVLPRNPRNIIESNDDNEDRDPPEQPAESAEAELSK